MLGLLLVVALALPVEVERVLATVRGVPILASDVELAELASLVPREAGESEAAYRSAVVEALIALQLRWQDLDSAAIAPRVETDLERAWAAVVARAGGEEAVRARLLAAGMPEATLRELVRRAAIVEAYVAARFAPFTRPSEAEIEAMYAFELLPRLRATSETAPGIDALRDEIQALLRERKLGAEVDRWTAELERRAAVVRYFSAPPASPAGRPEDLRTAVRAREE